MCCVHVYFYYIYCMFGALTFLNSSAVHSESLVALQLLLGLRPSDVLTTSAKESNTYLDLGGKGICYFIPKQIRPAEVQTFVESNAFRERHYGDELLYRVASANLDIFIHNVIGKEKFAKALEAFQQAKARVQMECPPIVGHCSSTGELVPPEQQTKCYHNDYGCGYECIDKLFDNGKTGAWLDDSVKEKA